MKMQERHYKIIYYATVCFLVGMALYVIYEMLHRPLDFGMYDNL